MSAKRTHSSLAPGRADSLVEDSQMAPPTYLDRAAPTWVRALLGALALCAALYAVLLTGATDGTGLPSSPESWWPLGLLGVAAGATCAARAAFARHERLVWALLGGAIASYGSGFLVWALVYQDDTAPPYPSPADALFIPAYMLILVALFALVRRERPRVPATAWLDALVPACAVSALATQLLLPHISTTGKPLTEQFVLLLYPALDVLLVVAIVLVLALRRWYADARWALLALAVLGCAVGDVLWSYLVAAGTYQPRLRRGSAVRGDARGARLGGLGPAARCGRAGLTGCRSSSPEPPRWAPSGCSSTARSPAS